MKSKLRKVILIGVLLLLSIYIIFQCKKEQILLSFAGEVFPQESVWFSYSAIDSLDDNSQFRYFFFYRDEVSNIMDKDSTLFFLNENVYSDSVSLGLKHAIYLPESAFPYISGKKNENMFYRVDSIGQREGGCYFKLTRDSNIVY